MYVNARAIIERNTDLGTEVLLQIRERAGEPRTWELPGGQLEEFEPILVALAREVREETGLTVTAILDETHRVVSTGASEVECLSPFFVYQTIKGPVDSVGFFFRCQAEGELTTQGDGASGHRWFPVAELAQMIADRPAQFDWLARPALMYYLQAAGSRLPAGGSES